MPEIRRDRDHQEDKWEVETWEVASVEVMVLVCKVILTIPSERQVPHKTIATTHLVGLHQVVVSIKALVDSKTKVTVANKTKVTMANKKKMPSGVCATFDFRRN